MACFYGFEKPLLFILAKVFFCKNHPKPLDKPLCVLKSRSNILSRRKGTVVVVAVTAKIIIPGTMFAPSYDLQYYLRSIPLDHFDFLVEEILAFHRNVIRFV